MRENKDGRCLTVCFIWAALLCVNSRNEKNKDVQWKKYRMGYVSTAVMFQLIRKCKKFVLHLQHILLLNIRVILIIRALYREEDSTP